jgi:hypothetical protein
MDQGLIAGSILFGLALLAAILWLGGALGRQASAPAETLSPEELARRYRRKTVLRLTGLAFCLAAAAVFFGGGGRLPSLSLLAAGGLAHFLAWRIRTAPSLVSFRPEVRP